MGNHTTQPDAPRKSWTDGDWYSGDDSYGDGYGSYSYPRRKSVDAVKSVEPLVTHLAAYDDHYHRLRTKGGRIRDLKELADLLKKPITLQGPYGRSEASLVNRKELNWALWDVTGGSIHLDVRQLGEGWPVYYLCRVRRDYLSNYGLIVEDLHRTSDHPFPDPRFVKLMDSGHEIDYLRLAPFRSPLERSGLLGKKPTRDAVDEGLLVVGRHVLQAAWNEDQQVGLLVAETLGVPCFGHAIELLYLCLSGELCELRGAVDDFMLGFFRHVLPQPAIAELLGAMQRMDGEGLTRLPQVALRRYADLSKAFNRFLSVPVEWQDFDATEPLYKLLFANLGRFGTIARRIAGQPALRDAADKLAKASHRVIQSIMQATTPTVGRKETSEIPA